MEKNLREIGRSIQKGEYSSALVRISSVYSSFYYRKVELSRMNPRKSFGQIANTDCPKVKEWLNLFYAFDNRCENMIKCIENIAKDENRFKSIEGDDIFKKMMSYRNHCKMFADKKNFEKIDMD
ncbi:hypothetical protein [Sulfurimonas sp.]|uniref:hypothetical protein n=1 Tax=Sulfurimonas sp. TaxID=2022749 RepID=UPI0025F59288|nr:hypothetical protein [Sulfurimonas sp.]MBW6487539.1 hypothetical protein [Sulfurimonas sp.]